MLNSSHLYHLPRRANTFAAWRILLCSGTLAAQTLPPDAEQTPDAFTAPPGSLPGRSLDLLRTPAATLTARELESTGARTNLLDALRKLAPQFTGSRNLGNENAHASALSTSGGSQLALRNLPTLVLLNGRRMATSPMAAAGGQSFADVNGIPMGAIERVEILSDGASAIYGADAMGGVVNVVLKSHYQGLELSAHYGLSENQGRWSERAISVTGGTANGTTNLMLSAEWMKSDPLFQNERDFSRTLHDTPTFAGVISIDPSDRNYRADGRNYYLLSANLSRPGVGYQDFSRLVSLGVYTGPYTSTEIAPSFNRADYGTLLQGNERKSAVVSAEHKLAPDLSVFGELLYVRTQTFSQLEPQPLIVSLAAGAPTNPIDSTIIVHNRLADFPRQYFNETQSFRAVAGIRGRITEDISWEVSAQQHEIGHDYRNTHLIDILARDNAVAAGTLVLTAREQPEGVEKIFGTAYADATSRLTAYDAVVRGNLFELPGGSFRVALSGQMQRESLQLVSDRNSQSDTWGWESGMKLDPFDRSRSQKSAALELNVPIFGGEAYVPLARALSFAYALRRDSADDFSAPTAPKYALRWQPFEARLSFHGSFSRSFSAPTLYQLYGPTEIRRSDPLSIASYDAFGNSLGSTLTGQAWVRSGANSALQASTAENVTLGVAYAPQAISGLSFAADYFHVNQYNTVGTVGVATILASVDKLGTESPYAHLVRIGKGGYADSYFDGGTAIADEGKISSAGLNNAFVSDQYINVGTVKLDGFDIAARYTHSVRSTGQFTVATGATVYTSYRVRALPDSPYEELTNRVTGNFSALPKWRSYTTVAYSAGGFATTLAHTYVPAMEDVHGVTAEEQTLASYSQVDLQFSYTFGREIAPLRGTKVTLGVDNAFNRFGPRSPSNTQSGVDLALYGAVGRKFYLGLQHKF